jgi:hypothetical protein
VRPPLQRLHPQQVHRGNQVALQEAVPPLQLREPDGSLVEKVDLLELPPVRLIDGRVEKRLRQVDVVNDPGLAIPLLSRLKDVLHVEVHPLPALGGVDVGQLGEDSYGTPADTDCVRKWQNLSNIE